jgi:hypothetical protein
MVRETQELAQIRMGLEDRASGHEVVALVRISSRVESIQPQRRRFMATLLLFLHYFSSDNVKRYSHARFSRMNAPRMRDSSSR